MAEGESKVPAEKQKPDAPREWEPFDNLRREIDRAFDVVRRGFWRSPVGRTVTDIEPFWAGATGWGINPAVDVVEKDGHYEIRAELPGMSADNIDVNLADGTLTIKGEKKEEKEEKKEDFYLSERRYGRFQRSFVVPQGVDPAKIEATFKDGVLTITLAKSPEAKKPHQKIAIKGA
jgi:HSP20 family protein